MLKCELKPLKMMIAIVDRGYAKKTTAYLDSLNIKRQVVSLGVGTAPTEMQALLGVGETEKAIILFGITADRVEEVFDGLKNDLGFGSGAGIAFTIPLSSIVNYDAIEYFLNQYTKITTDGE